MCKLNHKFLLASLFAIIVPVMTQSVEDSANAAPSASQFSASAEYNRALSLERGKKWQSAILILEKCVRYCPSMADAWLELGQCYLAVKDYGKAEKVLLVAQPKVSTESAQKRVMKALIHCYGMSGQLESLEKVRKQYLTCFPHEADSAVIREQIEYYDNDFARTRKLEFAQANYLKEGYLPWLKFSILPVMPIKVCIAPGKEIEKGNPPFTRRVSQRYYELARMALEAWKVASGETLKFEYVEKSSDAQLLCSWTTDLKLRHNCWADGEANYIYNSSQGPVCTKACVFLNSKSQMDDNEFYFVMLHEVGHALGLQHSSNPHDVMYSAMHERPKELQRLTPNDVFRIRRVYADPFLGSYAAEKFAQAAFIDRDYENAYSLLTADERSRVSMVEFVNKLRRQEPESLPTSLKVTRFDRCPNNRFNYSLEGSNGEKKFFYHVGVERTNGETFLVTQARLAASVKL